MLEEHDNPIFQIQYTDTFSKWFKKLRDRQAKSRIIFRLERIALDGFFGDVEPVGAGVSELRIHSGAGYRVYFIKQNDTIIVLLCGGDKDTQQSDIMKAKSLAQEYEYDT